MSLHCASSPSSCLPLTVDGAAQSVALPSPLLSAAAGKCQIAATLAQNVPFGRRASFRRRSNARGMHTGRSSRTASYRTKTALSLTMSADTVFKRRGHQAKLVERRTDERFRRTRSVRRALKYELVETVWLRKVWEHERHLTARLLNIARTIRQFT